MSASRSHVLGLAIPVGLSFAVLATPPTAPGGSGSKAIGATASPASNAGALIRVKDESGALVRTVRRGERYTVVADLGVGTRKDDHLVHVCFATVPIGAFRCHEDRAFNFRGSLYPFGTPLTVNAARVTRVRIRVLDTTSDTRLLIQRTIPVT